MDAKNSGLAASHGVINAMLGFICVNGGMEIVWDRISPDGWDAALPPAACALQQSWRYGAAVQAMGRPVHRAEIIAGGQRVVLAQVICRAASVIQLGFLARGPVWLQDVPGGVKRQALCLIRQTLPAPGRALLMAAPEAAEPGLLPLMTPVQMAEVSLDANDATLRRRMQGKWRNRLAKAETFGLSVARTQPDAADLGWLIAHDTAQQRARGYRALPAAFLTAWHDVTGDGLRLYQAKHAGQTVAAMLLLDHAPGATYQIGWTSDAGRAACAHHLLLWRAMQDFAGDGRRRLDLGTLDTVTAPGLARFKLGAGAVARALGPSGLVLAGWPWLRRTRRNPNCAASPGSP